MLSSCDCLSNSVKYNNNNNNNNIIIIIIIIIQNFYSTLYNLYDDYSKALI